jgi:hypothetical protein
MRKPSVTTIRTLAAVVALAALAMPAWAQQPVPIDSDLAITTPSGQVVLGTVARWDSADQATLILVLGGKPTRWQLSAAKAPAPTPVPPLSALAAEVRELAVQTVAAAERQARASALAAAYRGVSGRIKSGELKSLVDVQQAQTVANRQALGLPAGDPSAARQSPWYAFIVALAEKIKAAKPGATADLSPLSDQIADGLEASAR